MRFLVALERVRKSHLKSLCDATGNRSKEKGETRGGHRKEEGREATAQ
jgi:hypothetical protein